jgi:hypothetical protein
MNHRVKLAAIGFVGVAVAVLMGCSSEIPGDSRTESTLEYKGSVSLVETFTSLEEVMAASDLSARGVAGDAHVVVLHDIPFTITDFTVNASSDESMVGRTITIRQTGAVDYRIEGVTDILRPGQEYLLLVKAFEITPGQVLDNQYVITGEQGGWEIEGTGATPIFNGEQQLARDLSPDQLGLVLAG